MGLGSSITPMVKWLILINAGVFLIQSLVPGSVRQTMNIWLGLVPYQIVHLAALWQLVTYMFLHGNLFHILFNMFALWMFGSQLEREWGSKEFLKYYLITGAGAGLINVAFNLNSPVPTIGASGAVFGLLLAYGVLYPNNLILLYFFIPIKAKYFVLIFAALEFLMVQRYATVGGDGVAHWAHLGGMAVGLVYLRGRFLLRPFDLLLRPFRKARHDRQMARQVKLEVRRLADIHAVRSEIDYLLGRISRVGYENLTTEEKDRLEEASRLLRMHTAEPEDLS